MGQKMLAHLAVVGGFRHQASNGAKSSYSKYLSPVQKANIGCDNALFHKHCNVYETCDNVCETGENVYQTCDNIYKPVTMLVELVTMFLKPLTMFMKLVTIFLKLLTMFLKIVTMFVKSIQIKMKTCKASIFDIGENFSQIILLLKISQLVLQLSQGLFFLHEV